MAPGGRVEAGYATGWVCSPRALLVLYIPRVRDHPGGNVSQLQVGRVRATHASVTVRLTLFVTIVS